MRVSDKIILEKKKTFFLTVSAVIIIISPPVSYLLLERVKQIKKKKKFLLAYEMITKIFIVICSFCFVLSNKNKKQNFVHTTKLILYNEALHWPLKYFICPLYCHPLIIAIFFLSFFFFFFVFSNFS